MQRAQSAASSRRHEALRYGWLPPEPEQSATSSADCIVGWRLHLHDVSTDGLPAVRGGNEKGKTWAEMYVKFTAMWSHETITTAPFLPGESSHSWEGERFTLALPNATQPKGDADSAAPEPPRVPVTELRVQLCARIPGLKDEVVGADTCTLASRAAHVENLSLRGPHWMGQTARATFRFEMEGLTASEMDDEWNQIDASPTAAGPSGKERPASGTTISVTRLGKTSIGHTTAPSPQLNVVVPKKKGVAGAPSTGASEQRSSSSKPKLAFLKSVPTARTAFGTSLGR